jgi:CRISPR/Cas system-associated protein Cas5 (RAMP superfamily)
MNTIFIFITICLAEELKDTKEVIRILKSKDRQYNDGQKKKDKGKNNELQNTAKKTKDRATRTPQKTWDELRCS